MTPGCQLTWLPGWLQSVPFLSLPRWHLSRTASRVTQHWHLQTCSMQACSCSLISWIPKKPSGRLAACTVNPECNTMWRYSLELPFLRGAVFGIHEVWEK